LDKMVKARANEQPTQVEADVTEREWLAATDPGPMITFLREEQTSFRTRWLGWIFRPRFRISARKWRLFYCACIRRIVHLLRTLKANEVMETAEQFADGLVTEAALVNVANEAGLESELDDRLFFEERSQIRSEWFLTHNQWAFNNPYLGRSVLLEIVRDIRTRAYGLNRNDPDWIDEEAAEMARQVVLLREVIGNPFRPCVADSLWLAWNDGTIPRIARSIYDERRFEDMPILADALEDAGCCDETILTHCRGENSHVRGCFVIDSLLGLD
jgi:hypothetical protein